ncbi:MAG: class I SAM-dependent methyltransferase [Polyangiales bacterium]
MTQVPPTSLNPQATQMADASMVRTLAAQADAIWPQESALFARYDLAPDARILDAGCGTGEITSRLATLLPTADVLGVDILDGPLAIARARHAHFGSRVRFEKRSIFDLGLPSASFDLVACRHVLQSIPHADRVVAELARVVRPGGRLHLLAEDYGMIHFPAGQLDATELFPSAAREFGSATGTDLMIGRNIVGILQGLGMRDVALDYIVVDTLRVPRETFAAIWESWRDGYVDAVAEHTRLTRARAAEHFAEMIAAIRDPKRYAVWMVPVASARVS